MHWIAVGSLAAGLILVLVLGWQFMIKPLGAEYEAKVAAKADLEAQLATTKQRAAQFEKFKAQAENVRRDLDFYSRRLDQDLPTDELYTMVDGLGHSLNFNNWSFETKKRDKTRLPGVSLDEVEVTARFNSDFEGVGKLLNLCVGQVRLLIPDSLTLTKFEDPRGVFRETLKAEVVIKVLVSPAGGS
jgi:hypothetical protein